MAKGDVSLSQILSEEDWNWQDSHRIDPAEISHAEPSDNQDRDTLPDMGNRQSGRFWQGRLQAETEWWSAVSALTQCLEVTLSTSLAGRSTESSDLAPSYRGVIISGPLPVLRDLHLMEQLSTWLMVPQALEGMLAIARPLLPYHPGGGASGNSCPLFQTVPLVPGDGLAAERFSLLLTEKFSLSLVLGQMASGESIFRFSFDPDTNHQVWERLRSQVARMRPPLLQSFDHLAAQFPPVAPDFRLVNQFSRQLLYQMRLQPGVNQSVPASSPIHFVSQEAHAHAFKNRAQWNSEGATSAFRIETDSTEAGSQPSSSPDADLLKAMAHEIRTPLTTIRTFTRSLLKRKDLPKTAVHRLKQIDQECTQQIDRFNLFFRAVELKTDEGNRCTSSLSPISLTQIFQDAIPLWQQQASRRNLTLDVKLPNQLPTVASDPTMLHQVLTGIIDRFTHSLPPYSHINLAVTLAGHQLKLQFQSDPQADAENNQDPQTSNGNDASMSPFQALGQLLLFQPETGGLSLNLDATKHLFQALGGKLTVKQRPQNREVLTVFLPLETRTL